MMRVLMVAMVLFSLCVPAQARRSHELPTGLAKLHFNQAPPDFSFPDGKRYDKLSGLVGKPVVINFWATWCHACTDEFPAFAQMQQTYGERVAFITLSNEAEGVARAYLAGHHIAMPLLEDPHGVVFGAYSVALFPVTVVVSASGTVSYVSVGGLDWPELQAAVERAFQGGGPR